MRSAVVRAVILGASAIVFAGIVTCGEDSPTHPGAAAAAAIAAVAGDGQTGTVGRPLTDRIVVEVLDSGRSPLAGVRVAFLAVDEATGEVASPDTAASGSDGRVETAWRLPSAAGTATLVAHVVGAPAKHLSAAFTATAVAAAADTMFIVEGQDQAGPGLSELPDSLKVRVTDTFGNPVGGVRVEWTWTGHGAASPTTSATDEEGFAASSRTLGDDAPSMTTAATVAGLKGSPATFHHAVALPATVTILTPPSSTASSGTPFAQQPVIEVRDGGGTVINGIHVVASVESGGGSLSGTRTAVTAAGAATFTNLALSGAGGDQVLRFTAGTAFARSSPIAIAAGTAAEKGQWSRPVSMPLVAIHASLLPNGKVLMFSRTTEPYLWDPGDPDRFTAVPLPTNVFCSGHTLLPDGRVLVVGGHISDDHGLPDANIFDPVSDTWTRLPDMLVGRWYPTATVLANGEVLVLGGRDENGDYSMTPEIWTGSGWRRLTGSGVVRAMPYYPRMFVAPDGKTFFSGEWSSSRYFDQTGSGSWAPAIPRTFRAPRDYGSAVMYEPGKIIYIGGGKPPTNTAEIIDLNQSSPSWSRTGSMAFARRHMNATLLPDGRIFATGGTSAGGFNNASGAVHTAEMWSPATGEWRTLSANAVDRMYHSTSLLLPDGRVLVAGSGEGGSGVDQRTYELYSPPYLFRGARPTIGSAPTSVSYGQHFEVETPQALEVEKVSFIRLGSVTHAFDESQRFLSLGFNDSGGDLTVVAPGNANLAPPGHYLLTIVDERGVPSVSKIVKIQ
jgi:hypothetical protein